MTDEMKNLVKTVLTGGLIDAKLAFAKLNNNVNFSAYEFFEEVARLNLDVPEAEQLVRLILAKEIDFKEGLPLDYFFDTYNPNIINAALSWNGEGLQHSSRESSIENLVYKLDIQERIRDTARSWSKYITSQKILSEIHVPLHQELKDFTREYFKEEIEPFLYMVETNLSVSDALNEYLDNLDDKDELVLFERPGVVLDHSNLEEDDIEIVKNLLERGSSLEEAVLAGCTRAREGELRAAFLTHENIVGLALAGRYLTEDMGVLECNFKELTEISETMFPETTEELAQRMLYEYAARHETDLDDHLSFVSEEKKEEFLELFQEYKLERDEELER